MPAADADVGIGTGATADRFETASVGVETGRLRIVEADVGVVEDAPHEIELVKIESRLEGELPVELLQVFAGAGMGCIENVPIVVFLVLTIGVPRHPLRVGESDRRFRVDDVGGCPESGAIALIRNPLSQHLEPARPPVLPRLPVSPPLLPTAVDEEDIKGDSSLGQICQILLEVLLGVVLAVHVEAAPH